MHISLYIHIHVYTPIYIYIYTQYYLMPIVFVLLFFTYVLSFTFLSFNLCSFFLRGWPQSAAGEARKLPAGVPKLHFLHLVCEPAF